MTVTLLATDDDVHEAFSKKEYQVRGQRVKKGKILNKEELVEAQKINDEIHAARLAQADKEAHDALAAQVEALYNQAVGASAMQVFDTAVGALSQCLAIDPDYKPALVKLRELSSAETPAAAPDEPRCIAALDEERKARLLEGYEGEVRRVTEAWVRTNLAAPPPWVEMEEGEAEEAVQFLLRRRRSGEASGGRRSEHANASSTIGGRE